MEVQTPTDREREAALLRAMGHSARLMLLESLCNGEACVCHLTNLLERPQPYVSKQLAELREAGLVVDRREGQRIYYRLADQRVSDVLRATMGLSGREFAPERRHLESCNCPNCSGEY
jgi:DNA-binding transcriptional ArsR family regulator